MNHSIPAAMGAFIQSPAGNVLHTGDFKLDQTPIDGVRTDFAALTRFADEGVDLLMSDSTNANRPGYTPSEATVGPFLRDVISNAKGRVFVASFSSHIHRLQQVCDAAIASGRKVVVTGRSMLTNTRVARELGYLKIDEEDIIDAFDIDKYPENRVVVLCTGSQGEPLSALARMATGEHKTLQIQEGDTVIISATPVPGNEKAVTQIINTLAKIGADVYDKSRGMVHVSGHASQEELKMLMALTRPKHFMPVHGEATHLRAHAKLAQDMGVDEDNIFILDNGESLEMRDHRVTRGKTVESGVIYVDGLRISDTDQMVLADRKRLSEDGLVSVVATFSRRTSTLVGLQLSAKGVSFDAEAPGCVTLLTERVKKAIAKRSASLESREAVDKVVRDTVSSHLWETWHSRPVIVSFVVEV